MILTSVRVLVRQRSPFPPLLLARSPAGDRLVSIIHGTPLPGKEADSVKTGIIKKVTAAKLTIPERLLYYDHLHTSSFTVSVLVRRPLSVTLAFGSFFLLRRKFVTNWLDF